MMLFVLAVIFEVTFEGAVLSFLARASLVTNFELRIQPLPSGVRTSDHFPDFWMSFTLSAFCSAFWRLEAKDGLS